MADKKDEKKLAKKKAPKKTAKKRTVKKKTVKNAQKKIKENVEKTISAKKNVPVKEIADENVFQTGALIHLKISRWGARAKMNSSELGDDLPPEIIRGVKDLISDKELLDDLRLIKRTTWKEINMRKLPFPIDGLFFVPKKFIVEIDDFLKEQKKFYMETVDKFLNEYTTLKEKFKVDYPEFYDENKYPDKYVLRAKFRFNWSFRQLTVPDKSLEMLSPELYKSECQKFRNEIQEMKSMTVNLIANSMVSMTKRLQKQCTKGKVSQRTIDSIQKLLYRVDNVFAGYLGREDIKKVAREVEKALAGLDAKTVRDNEDYKKELNKNMKKITDTIKNMPDISFKQSIEL